MTDDGERVDAWLLPGLQRIRRWQSGHASHYAAHTVTLGALPDGRWVAEDSNVQSGSRAYRSREAAELRLTELMWEGSWREVPAAYDAFGKPVGGGWVGRGGAWVRESSEDTPKDR